MIQTLPKWDLGKSLGKPNDDAKVEPWLVQMAWFRGINCTNIAGEGLSAELPLRV